MTHTEKFAKGVSGKKLQFKSEVICNVSFGGKTVKAKVFMLNDTSNLIGTDGRALFDLWNLLINSFCDKVNSSYLQHKQKA